MVQRSVGQHDADGIIAGRERLCEAGVGAPRQDDDGARRAEQGVTVIIRNDAERLDGGQIAGHQGERFVAAPLALAQQPDGRFVARVARQVESAKSADGDDGALGQAALGFGDGR